MNHAQDIIVVGNIETLITSVNELFIKSECTYLSEHHMQTLSENLDPCYFDEPVSKSTFQQILEDPEKMEFVHKFFKLTEEDQDKMISNMGTINEEIAIDSEPSIYINTEDYELIDEVRDTENDGFCFGILICLDY